MEVSIMFKYKSVQTQLIEERRKNERLGAQSVKNISNIDYIAMMTDVELEVETAETEVSTNE
jgi:hypothetical protein